MVSTQDVQKMFDHLQWSGRYWGEDGALKYAQDFKGALNLSEVGLVSLHYGAATHALVRWRKKPTHVWWLYRFVLMFVKALTDAYVLAEFENLSADDCCVVGTVLVRGRVRKVGIEVLRRGLSRQDVSFETTALLLAELYALGQIEEYNLVMYVWGRDTLPKTYEQAIQIVSYGQISHPQLARMLRRIGCKEYAQRLAETCSVDQVLKAS